MKYLILVLGFVLSGCATTYTKGENVAQSKFDIDHESCDQERRKIIRRMDDLAEAVGVSNRMYKVCMEAHGYKQAQN